MNIYIYTNDNILRDLLLIWSISCMPSLYKEKARRKLIETKTKRID